MSETALAKTGDPIMNLLAQYKQAVASVLPSHLTPERMLRLAHKATVNIPKLRECTPISLINSVIEISMLGLDIGRTAHILPYKGEATVIIDYKGQIELAHRSNKVSSISLKPVYANDYFKAVEGTSRSISHEPAMKERGELIAAYAIVFYNGNGYDFEVVTQEDIDPVKKKAPGAKSDKSPWNKPEDEWTMWCKTAMHRLAKRVPQSPELQRAAMLEDLVQAGLKQNISHIQMTETDPREFEKPKPVDTDKVKVDLDKKLSDLKAEGQTSKTIDCPDTDKPRPASDCENCKKRVGCPAHDEIPL